MKKINRSSKFSADMKNILIQSVLFFGCLFFSITSINAQSFVDVDEAKTRLITKAKSLRASTVNADENTMAFNEELIRVILLIIKDLEEGRSIPDALDNHMPHKSGNVVGRMVQLEPAVVIQKDFNWVREEIEPVITQ